MARKSVWIFIEGEGGAQGEGPFRKAWQKFLRPIHEHAKSKINELYRFQAVPCGSGQEAMKRFLNPRLGEAGGLRLLLVDSEKPVADVYKPWAALGRDPPDGASDEDAYLMVQCLEAWLVTDLEAMRKLLDGAGKPRFKSDKVGPWQNPEKVPKATLFAALGAAVADLDRDASWDKYHARANLVVEFMSLEKLAEHPHMRAPKRFFCGVKKRISTYATTGA